MRCIKKPKLKLDEVLKKFSKLTGTIENGYAFKFIFIFIILLFLLFLLFYYFYYFYYFIIL